MRHRESQVGDAGFEVIHEAHLGRQVAHAMRQATLPGRARKANLDRLDDARGAVRGHQERIIQAAPHHVLEKRGHRLGIFFGARHHVQPAHDVPQG